MKKKMLVSMTIAILLVAALAATAFAAASVSGPSSVDPGETIQVTITGTGEGVNGTVNASGLEFVSVSSQLSAPGAFVLLPDYGTASVTYTYRVTATSGQVSVSLSNVMESIDGEATSVSGDSWSATVNAAEPTPSQAPSQTPSSEPSESAQPTGSASVAPTGSGSAGPGGTGSNGGSSTGNQDKMPKTGDATMDLWVLAVIAAGCTGAAVVAGKKVFSR